MAFASPVSMSISSNGAKSASICQFFLKDWIQQFSAKTKRQSTKYFFFKPEDPSPDYSRNPSSRAQNLLEDTGIHGAGRKRCHLPLIWFLHRPPWFSGRRVWPSSGNGPGTDLRKNTSLTTISHMYFLHLHLVPPWGAAPTLAWLGLGLRRTRRREGPWSLPQEEGCLNKEMFFLKNKQIIKEVSSSSSTYNSGCSSNNINLSNKGKTQRDGKSDLCGFSRPVTLIGRSFCTEPVSWLLFYRPAKDSAKCLPENVFIAVQSSVILENMFLWKKCHAWCKLYWCSKMICLQASKLSSLGDTIYHSFLCIFLAYLQNCFFMISIKHLLFSGKKAK